MDSETLELVLVGLLAGATLLVVLAQLVSVPQWIFPATWLPRKLSARLRARPESAVASGTACRVS